MPRCSTSSSSSPSGRRYRVARCHSRVEHLLERVHVRHACVGVDEGVLLAGACGRAPTAPTARLRSARVRRVPPARRPGCARPDRTRARRRPCRPACRGPRPRRRSRSLRASRPPRRVRRRGRGWRRRQARRLPPRSTRRARHRAWTGRGRRPSADCPSARREPTRARRARARRAAAGAELLGVVRRPRSTPFGPAPTVTPPVSPASTPTFTPSGPVVRSTPPLGTVVGWPGGTARRQLPRSRRPTRAWTRRPTRCEASCCAKKIVSK